MNNFNVLLYYKYMKIEDPADIMTKHKKFCIDLNIKGRIIIAHEGINGTISGPEKDCNDFKKWLKLLMNITEIDFKETKVPGHTFDKLSIKVKNDIIKMGCKVDPTISTGVHLKPSEFKTMMNRDDTIVVDFRSRMEHNLGKFKNAITFDVDNMYDIPKITGTHDFFINNKNKNKKILTYCTGGIKCEKASTFLLNHGFKNVYQLEGGIIRYSMEENGENFDGKCYVFDNRIGIDVNTINPKNISKCYHCNISCDTMINCMNTVCNKHTTMCQNCYDSLDSCCSIECMNSNTKRDLYVDYFKNINVNI